MSTDKSKLIDVDGLKVFKTNYDAEVDEKIASAGTTVTKESIENALGYTPASTNNIPTKVSDLANDSGYLTDFTEEDPTVPNYVKTISEQDISNWNSAKTHSDSAHAPSNAQANVQSDWNVTDSTSDSYIKNKPNIPTKLSELTNDVGFKTTTEVFSATQPTSQNDGDVWTKLL